MKLKCSSNRYYAINRQIRHAVSCEWNWKRRETQNDCGCEYSWIYVCTYIYIFV